VAEPGGWGLEMDLLATGSAISWLAGLFGTGMADATGCQVGMPGGHGADCSARGAALLAALAIDGARPGPEPAGPAAEPDPDRAAAWDGLWASYEQARHAIAAHGPAGQAGQT
jgi:hypothetical protein